MATPEELLSLSDSEIIDRIGFIGVEIKALETRKKDLVEELLARGFHAGDGAYFHGYKVAASVQWQLDRKKLEADKGEAFVLQYSNTKNIAEHIRVNPRADVMIAVRDAVAAK